MVATSDMIPDSERTFVPDAGILIDDCSNGEVSIPPQTGDSSRHETRKEILPGFKTNANVDDDQLLRTVSSIISDGTASSTEIKDEIEASGMALSDFASKSGEMKSIGLENDAIPTDVIDLTVFNDSNTIKFRSVCVGVDEGQSPQGNDRASISIPSRKRQRSISSGLYDTEFNGDPTAALKFRPYFPPYGSDPKQEGHVIRTMTRATQTESSEFPKPKRSKKSPLKSKLDFFHGLTASRIPAMQPNNKHLHSTFPKVKNLSMSRAMQPPRSQNSAFMGNVSPYKPPIILPQRTMLCASARPHLESTLGLKRTKSQAKKVSKAEDGPTPAVIVDTSTNRTKAMAAEESRSFPCRLPSSAPVAHVPRQPPPRPTSSTWSMPVECARHMRFNGLRKARNWFSFLSHPTRFDWLGHRGSGGDQLQSQEEILNDRKRIAAVKAASTTAQYEWFRRNPISIRLGKSKIHGVGVFSNEDIGIGQYIAEYKGEVIRNCLVERREKSYRIRGLGSYMFQIDLGFTIDGTMKGGMARFVNHSCDPNCNAKIINCDDGKKHIILVAAKKISKGDELSYDYKMPKEKDKIPCLCGSSICRKNLN